MRGLARALLVRGLVVAAIAIVLAGPGGSGMRASAADEADTAVADWTIALYINADNNLEACWDDFSLPFLLNLEDNPDVNIVAWVDRASVDGYEVVEFSGVDTTTVYCEEELAFGNVTTVTDFLVWADGTYPSDHLAVVMWDHGTAWTVFNIDEERMYGPQFVHALTDANVHIDVLGFDACLMASMERMYEIDRAGLVDFVVASEELVPGFGLPYDLMFEPVVADSSRTPAQLADDMVLGWEAFFGPSQKVELAAIDLAAYRAAIVPFEDWVSDMGAGLDTFSKAYNRAAKHAYQMSASQYQIDFLEFAQLLYEELGSYPVSVERTALADSTLAVIDAFELSVKSLSTGAVTRDCQGLSIWWGSASGWDTYEVFYTTTLWFPAETGWGEFLVDYNAL